MPGIVAGTPEEAGRAAETLGGTVAIKAQVLTGGRGKAGGIKVVKSPREAEEAAGQILGMDIRGHTVGRVYVEHGEEIEGVLPLHHSGQDKEAALDPVLHRGRVEIEEVAETNPEESDLHVTHSSAFFPTRCVRSPSPLDWKVTSQRRGNGASHLYKAFEGLDASLVELNPLVVTERARPYARREGNGGRLQPVQARRHSRAARRRGRRPQEERAQEVGLQYVKLDGDIGILGNGAGLVMSTLDVVAQAGGEPANFCDVGGGADAEQISTALDIVTSNEQVKSVLFNIFGGITRGDEVARGLLSAIERTEITLPIVVRLDGTNAEEGRRILAENTPENVVTEETMLEAARRAVELARDGGR